MTNKAFYPFLLFFLLLTAYASEDSVENHVTETIHEDTPMIDNTFNYNSSYILISSQFIMTYPS
ncbi:hypothetical protein gpAD87_18870 [Paenibacillus sp. AD87]|nr:hypothetical protein gpAD87_18870 [Paenibacillus sp. AD87]